MAKMATAARSIGVCPQRNYGSSSLTVCVECHKPGGDRRKIYDLSRGNCGIYENPAQQSSATRDFLSVSPYAPLPRPLVLRLHSAVISPTAKARRRYSSARK